MATAEAPANVSNAELVRWAFEQINEKDVEPLRGFWTPETLERFPDRTVRGADAIVAYFNELFAAVSDMRVDPTAVTEQGSDVFVQWQLTGRHTGSFMGIGPTGKALAIDGMDHFVIRDGKVVSNFVIFDRMQFAQQLGMMANDDTPADRALKRVFNTRTKLAAKLRR